MVSIVIVNYRNWQDTRELITALAPQLGSCNELVVYDNGSLNESKDELRQLLTGIEGGRFIDGKENLGFGAGVNSAIEECRHDFILLLNPDIHVEPNFLLTLAQIQLEPKAIYGFPTYDYYSGELSFWGGFNFRNRSLRSVPAKEGETPAYINGSAMIFHRTVRFVEEYFLYWEDAELGRRLNREGYEMVVLNVPVWDKGSTTIGRGELAYYYYHRNSLFFYLQSRAIMDLTKGIFVKGIVALSYLIRGKFRGPLLGLLHGVYDWLKNENGRKEGFTH